jgi:hypothetical protein
MFSRKAECADETSTAPSVPLKACCSKPTVPGMHGSPWLSAAVMNERRSHCHYATLKACCIKLTVKLQLKQVCMSGAG